MNKNEIEVLAAMHGVQVTAVMLLAHVITRISPVTHEQIAQLFEGEAQRVSDKAPHAKLARTALLQMAGSIRGSQPGGETWEQVLTRLRS